MQQGSDELSEGGQPKGKEDYLLLLAACLRTVYEAADGGKVDEIKLATCLTGLRALLGPKFMIPALCTPQLCQEVVTAVGALFHEARHLHIPRPSRRHY